MKERVADHLDAVGVNLDSIRFFKAKTNRSWLRDTGPTFVVNDELDSTDQAAVGLVDWEFNGWAKYPDHDHDNRLPRHFARWLDLPRWVPRINGQQTGRRRIVMEGGAIDVNGRGCLLATEECLLSEIQARNLRARSSGARDRSSATIWRSGMSCGSERASKAMTLTDTSTTWHDSSGPAASLPPSNH